MSIIAFDGFDLYDGSLDEEQGVKVRRGLWDYVYPVSMNLLPRNGGNAIGNSSAASIEYRAIDSQESVYHVIVGLAFMVTSQPNNKGLIELSNDVYIWTRGPQDVNSVAFRFLFKFGGGAIYPDTEYARDIWHYVELEFKGDLPDRYAKVWMNGALIYDEVVNSTEQVYDVSLGADPHWIDDFYLLDPTDASDGSAFQSRLGPIQIRPVPLSSDRTPSEATASSGGAKYSDVDEQPGANDKDATYNYVVNAPKTQMFGVTAYDADLPILALSSYAVVKQDNPTAGAARLAFVADDGTNQENTVVEALQGVYRMQWHDYTTMPDGSPLTAANIQAANWGYKISPDES